MKIYITRHGETLWNTLNLRQGWQDSPLTEKGQSDAIKLGHALRNVPFSAVYSSPLGRAYETAKLIIGDRTLPLHALEDLKEMGFGTWEGMPHDELTKRYGDLDHLFWHKPHLYSPIDGESFDHVFNRVENAMNHIYARKESHVLIVTHAIVKKAIYQLVKDRPLDTFWESPYMGNTALSIIEVNEKGPKFILEGDLSHLD